MVITGLLTSTSRFFANAQGVGTHGDSMVVEDVLRTNHDTVSHISVPRSRSTNDMAASHPSTATPRIISE